MNNLIDKLDNRMNPIVVKELRQGLQSWFIIIVVNVLLFLLSIACILTVMISPEVMEEASGGKTMCYILFSILQLTSMVLIPIYVIGRLCGERNGTHVDLFFTTTLEPRKIVRGKFVAGMALVTLLFSLCLPFLFFTHILRGFDIPSILFTLATSYVVTAMLVMGAAVIGSWSLPRIMTPFVILASLGFFFFFYAFFGSSLLGILQEGVQGIFREPDAILAIGIMVGVLLLIIKLLESVAIGLLLPPSGNRTLRFRTWSTIAIFGSLFVLLIGYLIASIIPYFGIDFWDGIFEWFYGWFVTSILLIGFIMLVATCEPDYFSRRIMKDRSGSAARRFFSFLYAHNASSGFAWGFAHLLGLWGTLLCFLIVYEIAGKSSFSHGDFENFLAWAFLFCCLTVAYTMLTKVIMRTILKPFPTQFAWAIFLALITFIPLGMMIFSFIISPSDWGDNPLWQIFVPVPDIGYGNDFLPLRCIFDFIGAAIMCAVCLPKGLIDLDRYLNGSALTENLNSNGPIVANLENPFAVTPEKPFAATFEEPLMAIIEEPTEDTPEEGPIEATLDEPTEDPREE